MIDGNQGQNIYPDPDNYPASSFPQPVPAPLVDPDDAGTLITVQYSWEWREVLLAAVDQLINPATWQGDSDEIKLALNRATNLKDLLANPGYSDLAPYWDSETGSDLDGAPSEDDGSPWYYHIYEPSFTFQENLENWFIGAFVAQIAGIDQALVFLTAARKFRLQFQADPYGGILDIILNSDLYGSVDTYAPTPTIISYNVIAPDDLLATLDEDDKIELVVRSTGDANPLATPTADGYMMSIVRKRLWEGELDAIIDMRTVGGQVQIMRDDGLGWVSVTNAEYVRYDGSLNPDMTGQFLVRPLTDTPAGIFRRALSSASASILEAQTEAGVSLFKIAANGDLAMLGTSPFFDVPSAGVQFRAGGASVFQMVNNQVQANVTLKITDNGNFSMKRRISSTPVEALKVVTGFDNSTLATYRAYVEMSIADAAGDHIFVKAGVGTGGAAEIGFLGAAHAPRQVVSGNDRGNLVVRSLVDAMATLGLVTDSTTEGTAYSFGVRQNDEEPCILEYQESGGAWTEFADLSLCIPPPIGTKYDVECDCIFDTYDGGETWVDAPISDPRKSDVYRTIPPSDGKCNSAASMVRYTETMVNQAIQLIDATTLSVDAVTLIISTLVILGPFGVFAIAVLAFWTLVVGIGSVTLGAEFSPELYDLLLCIINSRLETDGTLTDAGLALIYADIDASTMDADVKLVLHAIYGLMGAVGLSNAGGLGLDTDNCDDCTCEDNDLTASDGMFEVYPSDWGEGGAWIPGTGWQSTYTYFAGANAWRVGIRKRCMITATIGFHVLATITENSVAGIKVTRVSDGYVILHQTESNQGAGHPLLYYGLGGTYTTEVYIELYSSTATGTVTYELLQAVN